MFYLNISFNMTFFGSIETLKFKGNVSKADIYNAIYGKLYRSYFIIKIESGLYIGIK